MDPRKIVFQETAIVAVGELICTAAMVGVFALLGYYDAGVLWGGIVGAAIAVLNFFLMAMGTSAAADKAEAQNVAEGQKLIQLSYMGRMIGLLVILVICAKTEVFNLLALVIPLVFVRPVLTVAEIINKKGGNQS